MTAVFDLFGLSLAEVAIVVGAAIFLVDRLIDRMGLSPSARTLREENIDLLRINANLESEVKDLRSEVAVLRQKVADLQQRDMEHVLKALDQHERLAADRFEQQVKVLGEIRDKMPPPPSG